MEATTIKVPVGKIISSTDRKYGGEGNIETLAQSIKEHGLIHPIAVKELLDQPGMYRVIAGRRRYAAVKSLGWKNVDIIVHPAKADDEAIALAENVNREEMHPLDEAENFRRQLDAGKSAEEIARYYARSVSGIHHRVRLTNLIDPVKTMFRDGKINLSGAALIASLPDEDQEKFCKKYEKKAINKWDIESFIHAVQQFKLEHIVDAECVACKKRTHNTTPGLFEDYNGLEDVCFDGECYAKKWEALIAGMIAEQPNLPTENNIIFTSGFPPFFPKKAKTISLDGLVYEILEANDYSFKETTKKSKAKTARVFSMEWLYETKTYKITVRRVAYEKRERQTYGGYVSDPVKDFMVDHVPAVKPEEQKSVAEKLEKKFSSKWGLRNAVKEAVLDAIIEKRLEEESKESLTVEFLKRKYSGWDEEETEQFLEIGPDYQEIVKVLFGPIASFKEIPLDPVTEKIFTLLVVTSIRTNDMPDLDDSDADWENAEQSLFWKFAQMEKEDYLRMYQAVLDEAVKSTLNEPTKTKEETSESDEEDEDYDESIDDSEEDEE